MLHSIIYQYIVLNINELWCHPSNIPILVNATFIKTKCMFKYLSLLILMYNKWTINLKTSKTTKCPLIKSCRIVMDYQHIQRIICILWLYPLCTSSKMLSIDMDYQHIQRIQCTLHNQHIQRIHCIHFILILINTNCIALQLLFIMFTMFWNKQQHLHTPFFLPNLDVTSQPNMSINQSNV